MAHTDESICNQGSLTHLSRLMDTKRKGTRTEIIKWPQGKAQSQSRSQNIIKCRV